MFCILKLSLHIGIGFEVLIYRQKYIYSSYFDLIGDLQSPPTLACFAKSTAYESKLAGIKIHQWGEDNFKTGVVVARRDTTSKNCIMLMKIKIHIKKFEWFLKYVFVHELVFIFIPYHCTFALPTCIVFKQAIILSQMW